MTPTARTVLTCTCEGTMAPDAAALTRAGCAPQGPAAHQLCRAQLDRFRAALATGAPVTVACTQEAPLFREVAEAEGPAGLAPGFANIRETAGWTADAASSGPKMAALIAAAAVTPSAFGVVSMESAGVALVLGRCDVAVQAARDLAETLDITLLLVPGARATPPRQTEFPLFQGRIRNARGHLGAFELTVDAYAAPSPASRREIDFGPARDGAVSRADLVVDLSGGTPLFPAHDLRPGYFRADPRDPVAVAQVVRQAAQMVGTFDKPRHIDFAPDLCAHSRNRIVGCTRCLSLCPTGAITPAGDSVAIDPNICAGCGQCAAACPTGAATHALPGPEAVVARLRAGLRAFSAAGGKVAPTVLLHDTDHGEALIDASARFGRGLPADAIPFAVSEITQIGPEVMAAAFAFGAGRVRVLGRARPRHDIAGLEATLALMAELCAETGLPAPDLVATDDPDALEAALALPRLPLRPAAAFLPPPDKRGLLTMAVAAMLETAPLPQRALALRPGAPFGAVVVDGGACTLCHACTSACPAGALSDNPDRPELRFTETACVQCGLCAATCPESAITLRPQIDLAAWDAPRRLLHEEAPFACISCGKAFGTLSGIRRIQDRLAGHWMFTGEAGAARLRHLEMCEDCRVEAAVNEGFDPHGESVRRVRTAADYN